MGEGKGLKLEATLLILPFFWASITGAGLESSQIMALGLQNGEQLAEWVVIETDLRTYDEWYMVRRDLVLDSFKYHDVPKFRNVKPEFVSGEILVKFKSAISLEGVNNVAIVNLNSVNELNRRFEVAEIELVLPDLYRLAFPKDIDVFSVAREYESDPHIEYAEPNYLSHVCIVPNDANYTLQWAHKVMQSEFAWDIERGSADVVIAIIDTGVDWDHPDLAANIWNNTDEIVDGIDNDGNGYVDDVRGYDFVDTTAPVWPGEDGTERDNDPMDFHGHGTHCAGISAAVTNNRRGIAGMSWNSKIMPVRAGYKGEDGGGWLEHEDSAAAIKYAADNGAKIISMSWGSYGESAVIRDAVKYAYDKGVLLVAAAGNDATSLRHYPSAFDEVVAVAATDKSDKPASFTNFGKLIEVVAPGVSIHSTVFNDTYTNMSGTSMSTPHTAGVAALIWSRFPNMTRDQVRARLRYASDDLGDVGFDIYYGYGRVNAREAVARPPDDYDLLIFEWQNPLHIKLGKLITINTTVLNFGNKDQASVTVQLLVNGSIVDSASIGFLASGASATVSCSWNPTFEGKYNVTSYVLSVSGEIAIGNNVESSFTIVRTEEMFKVPQDYSSVQEAVDAADSGYRIHVAAGTYYERILVDKSVSLIGENVSTTIIDAWVFDSWPHGTGTVLYVNADDVNIAGFSVQSGEWGVVAFSDNNTITGNKAKNNKWYGILLYECSNNYLRNNSMTDNKYNFGVGGYVEHVIHDIDTSNTVDGKPIYYWVNQYDKMIPADAGYVCLVNCTCITVKDLNLTNNRHGVDLVLTKNSIVRNVNATNNALDGILLYEGSSNNTVTGCTSVNNSYGIRLVGAKNNTVSSNVATNNTVNGIYLRDSNNNTVASNWILDSGLNGISLGGPEGSHNNRIINNWATNNTGQGIGLWNSLNNTVVGNWAVNNTRNGIYLYNSSRNIVSANVASNNSVNGISMSKSLNNIVVDNWAVNNTWVGIGLWHSVGNTVKSNIAENNRDNGIYVYDSTYNAILNNWALNNRWNGISISESSNNIIHGNTVMNNTRQGIGSWDSSSNTVSSNWAESNMLNGFYFWNSTDYIVVSNWALDNGYHGIAIDKSRKNLIGSNMVANNTWQGIILWHSVNNTIRSNLAQNNEDNGFYLYNSTSNTITGNTAIRNKRYGIWTYDASNNLIYNNDFVDNKVKQAYNTDSMNIWDKGYEYGGNYWSDYIGKDEFSGPNQNVTGSDGIGDTPYVIDKNNQDRYPRMTTLVYDVTIINVTSSIHTYAGWTVDINVTIKNNGYTMEDLIVVAYYDNNTIGTATIIGLAPGGNVTVTIRWDTTNVQLYTEYIIWAEAIPVPGETILEDNIMVEKTVKVRIPCDINGDGRVNIVDITTVAIAFKSKPGDPNWNEAADLDGNREVNIIDITRVAIEIGKTY